MRPSGVQIDLGNADTIVGTATAGHPWLIAVAGLARRHAKFSLAPDGSILVEDLATKNGTQVNGVRIREVYRLRPRDQIRMGELIVQATNLAGAMTVNVPYSPPVPILPPAQSAIQVAAPPAGAGGGRTLFVILLLIWSSGGKANEW